MQAPIFNKHNKMGKLHTCLRARYSLTRLRSFVVSSSLHLPLCLEAPSFSSRHRSLHPSGKRSSDLLISFHLDPFSPTSCLNCSSSSLLHLPCVQEAVSANPVEARRVYHSLNTCLALGSVYIYLPNRLHTVRVAPCISSYIGSHQCDLFTSMLVLLPGITLLLNMCCATCA